MYHRWPVLTDFMYFWILYCHIGAWFQHTLFCHYTQRLFCGRIWILFEMQRQCLFNYIEEPRYTCNSFIISTNKCTQWNTNHNIKFMTSIGTRVPSSGGRPKQRNTSPTRQFRHWSLSLSSSKYYNNNNFIVEPCIDRSVLIVTNTCTSQYLLKTH